MDFLFTLEEINAVKEKYQIDLLDVINSLSPIEELPKESSKVFIEPRLSIVELVIKRLKVESFSYSSLRYYMREVRKTFQSSLENDDKKLLFLSFWYLLWCSLYNHMCYLVEMSRADDNMRPNIIVFEACPRNLSRIKTREEAHKIKQAAIKYGFNPILRFGTNINVFKDVCNNNRLDYIHFAGHGEGNGDLAFEGVGGGSRFLGYLTFEKFFSNEYTKHYPNCSIKNIYLNSCNSDKFAKKIYESTLIGTLFEHSVSHNKDNPDAFALESSSLFYEEMMQSKSIESGFNHAKESFVESLSTDRNNYANAMVLL